MKIATPRNVYNEPCERCHVWRSNSKKFKVLQKMLGMRHTCRQRWPSCVWKTQKLCDFHLGHGAAVRGTDLNASEVIV